MAKNGGRSKDELPNILTAARDFSAVAAIFLFFAGFVFHYYYQSDLGIPHDAQAPVYAFLIFAWTSISTNYSPYIAFLALASAIFVTAEVARTRYVSPENRRFIWSCEIIAWFLLLSASLPVIYNSSRTAAHTISASTRRGVGIHPSVFAFKDSILAVYPELKAANAANALRIVGESPSTLYILNQPFPSDASLSMAQMYAINKADVTSYVTPLP